MHQIIFSLLGHKKLAHGQFIHSAKFTPPVAETRLK
jgi:hypothetical protein